MHDLLQLQQVNTREVTYRLLMDRIFWSKVGLELEVPTGEEGKRVRLELQLCTKPCAQKIATGFAATNQDPLRATCNGNFCHLNLGGQAQRFNPNTVYYVGKITFEALLRLPSPATTNASLLKR